MKQALHIAGSMESARKTPSKAWREKTREQLRMVLCMLLIAAAAWMAYREFPGAHGKYKVKGIDVSHYQESIDWNKVAKSKLGFVFVKATEGISLNDQFFCDNWEQIKLVQLRRGAYHFFRPSVSPEQQALNFIRHVNLKPGDLPPVLDVEVLDGVNKIELMSNMITWLYMVEIAYGVKPIIYTNQKFYNTYLAGGHFKDYPLWIARYHSLRQPRLADGRQWQFWQHKDTGELPGIEGAVDFNVFQGSENQLEALCMPAETEAMP
jgi:lysozyme